MCVPIVRSLSKQNVAQNAITLPHTLLEVFRYKQKLSHLDGNVWTAEYYLFVLAELKTFIEKALET